MIKSYRVLTALQVKLGVAVDTSGSDPVVYDVVPAPNNTWNKRLATLETSSSSATVVSL